MQTLLIYNPAAGDGDHEGHELRSALRRHGDDVGLLSSIAPDFERAIRESDVDLLVAAGGDGTVAKVIRAVMGHRDTPILVIPMGTANNIARDLGIEKPELDLHVVRESWTTRAIDVGLCGNDVIVEAAGCGVLPAFMRAASGTDRDGVHKEAKSLAEVVETMPLFDYGVSIDGEELTGEALLIEVMVLTQAGPNIVLASDADPGDGLLDVVICGDAERAELRRYLKTGGRRHIPELPVRRTKRVSVRCKAPWHFDDECMERESATIEVRAGGWRAVVPKTRA